MTINGTKLSVRLLGATLALATCGLLTGNAQAQSRIYVSLNNNSIVSYDTSLTTAADVEASKVVFTSTNLNFPRGLAFDSSGNLFAANQNNGTISKFDSTGVFQSTIGSGNLSAPYGLAFDSSGNLYAANAGDNTISKFDSTGSFQSTIGSGNLSFPYGLAIDSSGNLFAANLVANTISKFDSTGSFLFSFNTPSGVTPFYLTIGGNPPAVPEPGAVAFGIIAAGSVLGLVARKRRS